MKISAIDIKPGNVLEHQGKLWLVVRRELVRVVTEKVMAALAESKA